MPFDARMPAMLETLARSAGERILVHYAGKRAARPKADQSPVTEADIEANTLIVSALMREYPEIPVVSEENEAQPSVSRETPFFLVDPLDGTLGFIRGDGEFTVNIALVQGGVPRLGVVYAPVLDALYVGGQDIGAWRETKGNGREVIQCRERPATNVVVARSRSKAKERTVEFLSRFDVGETRQASGAIKLCWVAEGSADLYPRFGTTMEWDTAAGHAILNAAGGRVTDADGTVLSYGKPDFRNDGFVAWGRD